ncbi:MAG: GAF domain-containing protein, partial [Flavobacteriales bacterium]|nr:GAF domain-containing protein [Flavobacteriales bacterium]
GSLLGENLKSGGIQSYFAIPVSFRGEKLGFLELGSQRKGALNSTIHSQIQHILPILAVAGNRFNEEFDNKVEAVIQERFTTIHPSVKWRFTEEAMRLISTPEHQIDLKDIVFRKVYPLFGQLDIRQSTLNRNEAVRKDMIEQMDMAAEIITSASRIKKLPIYEEILYNIMRFKSALNEDIDTTTEHAIIVFVTKELNPLISSTSKAFPELSETVEQYEKSLKAGFEIVYQERAAFDRSLNEINRILTQYIDEEQLKAQKMFPHYFERYKTDGVEFNMYIGESIAPGQGFDLLYYKNLRLWQLLAMIQMERKVATVRDDLPLPLEIASLILAFSTPLSIHFRIDEKRFDVEGAYNARYEIIKKRLDKAYIKGTEERITCPGKMVVVYSSESDEQEYLRYFRFLQAKGLIKPGPVQRVTLQDLQGVSGLKALRADIDYSRSDELSSLSMDDIIAEIEESPAEPS